MDYEKKLEMLLRLGRKISRENDMDRLLQTVGDFATEIVGAERCSIFLYDPRENTIRSRVAHGVDEIVLPANVGLVGAAIQSREVQISFDAAHDARFYGEVDQKNHFRTRSLLAVPLFDKRDGVLGVVEMINKKEGIFSSLDAELMVLLSSFVSATIENAVLYRQVQDAQTNLIYRLSTAAEFKDEETSLHTKRVAYYGALIGRAYGLGQDAVDALILTAPMHDVGKIGIPDDIIRKPGRLTAEEFEQIKTHTTIGFNILNDPTNEILLKAALIARDHHEKWDGSGYPQGIAGKDISLDGRIVAIVDVFDALTSRRPYKEPWPVEKALELLRDQRGKHFDADLVELFLADEAGIIEIYKNYQEDE